MILRMTKVWTWWRRTRPGSWKSGEENGSPKSSVIWCCSKSGKHLVQNLREGDLGLVKYEKKFGSEIWKLARIVSTKVDQDGLFRMITVAFRPHNARDKGKAYKPKVPVQLEIGV